MKNNNFKIEWEKWRDQELKIISPLLNKLGFELKEKQIHIKGERYISIGKKLILIAQRKKDNKKVIIKISKDKDEIKEIKKERQSRKILEKINFSYRPFLSPPEILFIKKNKYYIFITEFIEQNKTFLERNLEEQFFFSLKSFDAQEGAHITTLKHFSLILKTFESIYAQDYLNKFKKNKNIIISFFPENKNIKNILEQSFLLLKKEQKIINLYSDFLTHWDFVPHNFRIRNNKTYLLDHSALHFGNKYEGQARFINFMILYNRPLEKMLLNYIKNNRSSEELLSLKLMRIFRLEELILHYARSIQKADSILSNLNLERFRFWSYILEKVLKDEDISDEIINKYKKTRDSLRSTDENERQKKLH